MFETFKKKLIRELVYCRFSVWRIKGFASLKTNQSKLCLLFLISFKLYLNCVIISISISISGSTFQWLEWHWHTYYVIIEQRKRNYVKFFAKTAHTSRNVISFPFASRKSKKLQIYAKGYHKLRMSLNLTWQPNLLS